MTYQPDAHAATFLLGDEAKPYLAQAARFALTAENALANISRLRASLPPDLAAAVLAQATLRQRAAAKFDRADAMLFTSDALEQASGQLPARHRASHFVGRCVADVTCSIGGDALATAEVAAQTLALDCDIVRLQFARHNLAAYGLAAHFIQADALHPPFDLAQTDIVFADPGRRSEHGRTFAPRDYQPPLDALYQTYGDKLVAKVAPGIDYAALDWPAEVEIVSLNGDVKEAVLWGKAAHDSQFAMHNSRLHRRATLLPSGDTITDADAPDTCAVVAAGQYIYEPNGAVIRAGLVRNLAAMLGLWQLDRQIAYLSGDAAIDTPFARCFWVEQVAPFGLKQLTARLRERGVGSVEIKKRGLDIDPDALRRQLKLHGPNTRTVILTRVGAQPMMYICLARLRN